MALAFETIAPVPSRAQAPTCRRGAADRGRADRSPRGAAHRSRVLLAQVAASAVLTAVLVGGGPPSSGRRRGRPRLLVALFAALYLTHRRCSARWSCVRTARRGVRGRRRLAGCRSRGVRVVSASASPGAVAAGAGRRRRLRRTSSGRASTTAHRCADPARRCRRRDRRLVERAVTPAVSVVRPGRHEGRRHARAAGGDRCSRTRRHRLGAALGDVPATAASAPSCCSRPGDACARPDRECCHPARCTRRRGGAGVAATVRRAPSCPIATGRIRVPSVTGADGGRLGAAPAGRAATSRSWRVAVVGISLSGPLTAPRRRPGPGDRVLAQRRRRRPRCCRCCSPASGPP